MSMLSTVGIQLAIDAYGPIVDNAGGIAVMSNMSKSVRKVTDHLDAVGNTTAAIGKGFAIGSAALTAFALFNAYQSKVTMLSKYSCYMIIDISKPHVVAGMFIGGTLPFIFSSLTIKAVNSAAERIIFEIRDQFKQNPNILSGKELPNYKKCIDFATISAIKGMIRPGLLAIIIPILSGLVDKTGLFLAGVLIGSTVTGVLMAIFMANTGGAWDNAKKQVEESMSDTSELTIKEQHAATITGDTVGDPFKDTAGPSINILIKLMSIVALMIVPLTIKYGCSFFV
jgi:K(+)-stimulated pyrophosphate-energized sodium pump